MLTIGLVGAGGIARAHLRAFVESEYARAVKLAEPRREAREAIAGQFGIIKAAFESIEALLEDPDVDVIDLCTPHYLHCPQAVAALAAGKHVIVEKPMALTVAECDEMIAAAERSGRRLFVALCQRMFPAHIRARQLIDRGVIGQPFLGVVNIYGNELERMNDPDSWKGDWAKAGGGALFDTGYHAVYVLQHFFGPATAVVASLRRLRVAAENKADDTSVAALEFGARAVGCVTVTYCATGDRWTEERRIVGDEGSLLIRDDPEDGYPLVLLRADEITPIAVHTPLNVHPYGIARVLDHFLECIVEDKPEEVTAEEARAAVATCNAAYESARTGRRVEIGAEGCEGQ